MAKIFHSSNILTNGGNTDVIEIWDEDFSGSSTEFRAGEGGYRLNYENRSKRIDEPILTATLSFEMVVHNSTHAAIISDLTSSKEGRFKIKLIRGGALRWAGIIVTDLGEVEDISYPYLFPIEARDLGALAVRKYSVDDDSPYTGKETFLQHIVRAVGLTDLLDFGWGGSDIAFTTVDNWWENSHTVSNSNDPIALTRFDHRALYEVENSGSFKFMSALDVLRQIMQRRGCQMKQSAGRFIIQQITELDNATPRARHYDRAGGYLSNDANTYTLDISARDNNGTRLAGGKYTWLPEIKEVTETYRHRNWVNIIAGATFDGSTGFVGPTIETGAAQVSMLMDLTITREMTNNSNPYYSGFYEIYRMTVRVGDKYLSRPIVQFGNYSIQYQTPATWTDDVKYFYFHIQQPGTAPTIGDSEWFTSTVTFTLPKIVESGEVLVNLNFDRFAKVSNGDPADLSMHSISATGNMLAVENANQGLTETVYTAQNATASSTSITIPLTSLIADGTQENTMGRLQVFDGSEWTNSSLWKIGGTGDGYLIQNLLIKSLAAFQKTPVQKMVHTVGYAHSYEAYMRLDDGDDIWVFMGGTYTAAMDDWHGEWYRVTYSPTDIDILPDVEVPVGSGYDPNVRTPIGGGLVVPGGSLPGNTVPEVPLIGGQGGFVQPGVEGLILGGLSGSQTTTTIPTGPVTSIPIRQTLVANAYIAGQQISIIDANLGINQTFLVTQNSEDGDTAISVSGYAVSDLGPGAFVVTTGANGVQSGFGEAGSSTEDLWTLIRQRWTQDNTNDAEWPIEAYNIGMETNEDAGDGSTAGFRIDGDGVSSYTASSATPGVQITTDGKLKLSGLATGTATDVLIVESGEVKQKTISGGTTDHGALTGLADDDHSQYHNDTRGDARYYTKVALDGGQLDNRYYRENELDAGQLDNRYFTESEHISVSTGASSAGKPIKLDSSGHVDASMINDNDIDHGSIGGLGDDDHTQYHNNTRGDARYYQKSEHISATTGVPDQFKPVKTASTGLFDDSLINFKHVVHLKAVNQDITVTQSINHAFYDATWLVPAELHDYYIYRVDYAILDSTATTGSLKVGLRFFNTSNVSVAANQAQVTFSSSDVRKTITPNIQLDSGYFMHVHTDSTTAGTLNNTVKGLLVTLYITKY